MINLFNFSNTDGFGATGTKSRQMMVDQLKVSQPSIKKIMVNTPRHYFIDQALSHHAHHNIALPIGFSQTISPPSIVAEMSNALLENSKAFNTILEVGTGCGYQTAILAQMFKTVYTIERIAELHKKAKNRLDKLKLSNIHYFHSDGSNLQKHQVFDAIILTAAPREIPKNIIKLLAKDGCLIAPEGAQNDCYQKLIRLKFDGKRYKKKIIGIVDFVPFLEGLVI
jgi:protein-L-isoaspartate(D-aspartate) O-methyltransferase